MNEEYLSLLQEVSCGNAEALKYLITMSKVFRIWDDLWDQDAEVGQKEADEVFRALSFELGRNGFFLANRAALEAFVFSAWNAWQDSNLWKGNPEKAKGVCAWHIRDYCNEIDALVAFLVGGVDHARKISLKCREFYLNQLVARGTDGFYEE